MPNHVVNEIVFRGVDAANQSRILDYVTIDGFVDFEKLLPPPLNSWPGSVGEKHTKAFPTTHLDWARENWGTKWNAYGKDQGYTSILRTDDTLTLTFQSAWSPPYGWIVALFNIYKGRFEHNWLSEGGIAAKCGVFDWSKLDDFRGEAWVEIDADEAMGRHLHKLLWGVEEFAEED